MLLDPNRLEVPSIVSRDKSSNRDAAGSTPDAARGVTREDKAFLEEEGLAQAASTLKKRKRVKKSTEEFRSQLPREGSRGGRHQLYFWFANISPYLLL